VINSITKSVISAAFMLLAADGAVDPLSVKLV
jgi:CubicO group peptidase (beta-lactamase class C family)